ncbi:hypothetical protein [Empedobacter brevis]|uniref:hypothetical protein n=1 Tax=Empedobacter brevis TaxID=247 RepID=UPI0028AF9B72|nr:hypothetical protein [Empedobacter brevis]
MKQKTQYLGIALGAIYGLLIRILGDQENLEDFYNIYSISFLWITPIIIGLFPILFSSNEIYKSKIKLFFYPIITVILFFIIALITRMEDLVCLLIIGLPFLIIAGIIGLLLGAFVKNKVKDKKLYSILLIPLLLNPVENLVPNKTESYHVSSEIIINKSKEDIFPNLLDVPAISESDYTNGFYQKTGIPRPISSEMFTHENQLYRIGNFMDHLKLYEYVSEMKTDEFVNFKIDLSKSQLRNTPTDKHLLKSNYFNFENINYTLVELSENKTKVMLNCDYKIESKMNFYAHFWAKNIIQDFEERLLNALKITLENED